MQESKPKENGSKNYPLLYVDEKEGGLLYLQWYNSKGDAIIMEIVAEEVHVSTIPENRNINCTSVQYSSCQKALGSVFEMLDEDQKDSG